MFHPIKRLIPTHSSSGCINGSHTLTRHPFSQQIRDQQGNKSLCLFKGLRIESVVYYVNVSPTDHVICGFKNVIYEGIAQMEKVLLVFGTSSG